MAFYDYLMRIDDIIINIAFKTKHILRTNNPNLFSIKRRMKKIHLRV